jgi:pimeloyl-ACP methyl ester carboxylesterase
MAMDSPSRCLRNLSITTLCMLFAAVPPLTAGQTGVDSTRHPAGETRIELKTWDHVRIVGSLYYPSSQLADTARPSLDTLHRLPGVILLHMWRRTRREWDPLIPRLQAMGMAVVSIDMRGHGESEPHRPEPGPGYYTKYMLSDGIAAYDYMRRLPRIDMRRVGLVGASIGTTNAIRLCDYVDCRYRQEPIAALALLSPALSYHGVNIGECLARSAKTATLFMMASEDPGAGDTAIYRSGSALFHDFRGEKKALVHPGVGHGINLLEVDNNTDSLVAWLASHLSITAPAR